MQAYLKELSPTRHGSESFHICQRVLNQCHEMIYGDLPASGTPYSTLSIPSLPGMLRRKVKPNATPALVGIGVVLAGAPVMPSLTEIMGEVAIEQGRFDDQGGDLRSLDNPDGLVRTRSDGAADDSRDEDQDDISDPEDGAPNTGNAKQFSQPPISVARSNSEQTARPGTRTRSRSQTVAAQTSPQLPLHLKTLRKPRLSEDPFGQNDAPFSVSIASPSPFQSTPTFSASRHVRRPNSLNTAEALLHKYDAPAQKYLLRSHFCRSEVCCCNIIKTIASPAV